MKIGVSFLIAASVLLTAIASAQDSKEKPSASLQPPSEFTNHPPPTPTTKAATPTTKPTTTPKTTKPTTTPKTTKPTTTPKTTKPTTTPKTTKPTTTKPTTTPKPITTPKPTTTTAKPNTTTTKPITTPVPGPTPGTNATVGNYNYTEGGTLYVMAKMVLQIRVNDSKTGGVFTVQQNLTKATGLRTNDNVTFTLTFKEGDIVFVFQRNTTSKTVYVNRLGLNLTYAFKTGEKKKTYSVPLSSNVSMELFKTAIGHSYSCKNESIYLGKNIFLDISQDRMQAFNFTKNDQFGQIDLCKADQPDYTVAIAVGIVLLILIVIVILAYACSRQRRSDGYQSL